MSERLGQKTIQSVRLTFAASILGGLVQAGVLVVLARLLTPLDYGLVAAALAIVRPVQSILFNGLERAVILHDDLSEQWVGAVAGMNLLIGLAASVLVCLAAGAAWLAPAGRPFAPTIAALSPILAITGLGVVPRAMLRRRMEFGRLALADLVSQAVGQAVVGVIAARLGFGAFSLVLGYMAQGVIQAAMNLVSARAPFGLRPSWSSVRPVLHLSYSISRTSIVELVHVQAPAVVLAALGPVRLGLFSRAYSLIQLPVELIGVSMSRVLYSGFSLVRDDQERLRRACRSLIELGSAAVIPLCCGMGAAAPDLVHVVLSDKWSGIVPVIPWICLGSTTGLVAHFYSVMTEAAVRLDERFRVQLWATVALIAGLLLGVRFGIVAGAAAFALGNIVFLVGNVLLSMRILALPARVLIGWSVPAVLTGLCLIAYVVAVRWSLPAIAAAPRLAVEVVGCGVVSVALYAVFWRRTALDFIRHAGLGRFLPASMRPA